MGGVFTILPIGSLEDETHIVILQRCSPREMTSVTMFLCDAPVFLSLKGLLDQPVTIIKLSTCPTSYLITVRRRNHTEGIFFSLLSVSVCERTTQISQKLLHGSLPNFTRGLIQSWADYIFGPLASKMMERRTQGLPLVLSQPDAPDLHFFQVLFI